MPVTINGSSGITANNGSVFTNASGNVGIGTSTPAFPLDVNTTIQDSANFASSNANMDIYLKASGTTSGFTRLRATGGDMVFITGLNERMRIDSAGRVTTPSQPAFLAFANNPTSLTTDTTNRLMPFTSVQTNVGSHYDSSTSRFTAPIAGTYLFCLSVLQLNGMGSHISLFKNGVAINPVNATWRAITANNNEEGVSGQAIVVLSANDFIQVYYRSDGSGQMYGGHGSFSGYLLG